MTNMKQTEFALRDWRSGQSQAERLCAGILSIDGFHGISPQAPLGGPDGGRDIIAYKGADRCVAAVYFPVTEAEPAAIREKFERDFGKAQAHMPARFVFMTNQRVSPELRDKFAASNPLTIEVYERERLMASLNSPRGLGLRLEYLNIGMTHEEQLSHWCEWKGSITNALGLTSASLEELRTKLQVYIDERLDEARSRNFTLARLLVVSSNMMQLARPALDELEKSRPFISAFVEGSANNFEIVSKAYREYLMADALLSPEQKARRIDTLESGKRLMECGMTVFGDGRKDKFTEAIESAFKQAISTVDPKCPDSAEAIQKEIREGLLATLVKQRKPLARLELLNKILLESDGLIERALDDACKGEAESSIVSPRNSGGL